MVVDSGYVYNWLMRSEIHRNENPLTPVYIELKQICNKQENILVLK